MHTIAVIAGTRPEAIKLAPVIQALSRSTMLAPLVVSTSQHREMVGQVFGAFDIGIDHDLKVMRPGQTLWHLSSRLAERLGEFFQEHPVSAVLVQGDTTSAFFGGLCAYYHKIPVGHVEAGLRTGNAYSPFPEEMNRKLLGALAMWHFAPTRQAKKYLRNEGVPAGQIHLTGNTVVDALRWMALRCSLAPVKRLLGPRRMHHRLILVTCHRRENLGAPMASVARALAALAQTHPDVVIVFPVHPNPSVREVMQPPLKPLLNVVLCEPLNYDAFLAFLRHAYFVISDSGGVQEEATALGKPVLVLRKETERQEGVKAGALKLVGTDENVIVRESAKLLNDPVAHARMTRASDVFGDGQAAERIVRVLESSVLPMGAWR